MVSLRKRKVKFQCCDVKVLTAKIRLIHHWGHLPKIGLGLVAGHKKGMVSTSVTGCMFIGRMKGLSLFESSLMQEKTVEILDIIKADSSIQT